ncbi:hypothetical protein LM701014_220015 [Listeria monocytogenes]|nr:hypothetical protein LM700514_40645 [Listeria monocytogenes]CUK90293.1 hypothetical protein LM701014_220015 [Listeria monocytogenes]CUL28943.1 hypothetical protein LM7420_140014 [Listeria monocytogenes]
MLPSYLASILTWLHPTIEPSHTLKTYSGYLDSCPPYSCGGSFGIAPNSSFRNVHTFHQHKTYLTTYILPQSIYKKTVFI